MVGKYLKGQLVSPPAQIQDSLFQNHLRQMPIQPLLEDLFLKGIPELLKAVCPTVLLPLQLGWLIILILYLR